MRYLVYAAPDGITVMSIAIDGTLHIWVSDTLNELDRRRYIGEKLSLYGISPLRRRLAAILPLSGGRRTHTTAAVAGGAALAVGVATVAALPFAIGGDSASPHPTGATVTRTPPAALPKNPQTPAGPPVLPPTHADPPKTPSPPASATPAAQHTPRHRKHRHSHLGLPAIRLPGADNLPDDRLPAPQLPDLPSPPPGRTGEPPPLLVVSLPPAGTVRLSPTPRVRIRLGSRQP